jgi:valyl-tRNA synthetase
VKFSNWLASDETPDNAAIVSVTDLDIFVPLEDVIDKESEIKRLEKEIEKLQKDITVGRSRLDNPGYVQKAPAEVVAKERERVQAMEEKVAKAERSLEQLR